MTTQFSVQHLLFEGDLTPPRSAQLKVRVLDAIGSGANAVILDMRESKYIDTASLNQLCSIARACKTTGVRLIVAELQPEQLHLFHVARIDTLFEIVGTVQRARELLEEPA